MRKCDKCACQGESEGETSHTSPLFENGHVEVIVVFEAWRDPRNLRVVEKDDFHDVGLEKQRNQFGRGLAVVLGIAPPRRKLQPVLSDQTDINIEAALMTLVRIEFAASGQADVSDPDFAFVHALPAMLDQVENREQPRMCELPTSKARRTIYVVAKAPLFGILRELEVTA